MPYVLRVLRVDLSFVCCTTGAGYLENCFASVVVVVIFRDRTFNQLVKKNKKQKQDSVVEWSCLVNPDVFMQFSEGSCSFKTPERISENQFKMMTCC